MTLNRHDKFAFLPKKCDKCRRTFIFEPYDIYYKFLGIPNISDLELIKCRECIEKENNNGDNT